MWFVVWCGVVVWCGWVERGEGELGGNDRQTEQSRAEQGRSRGD